MLAGLLNQFHDFDTRITAYDRHIRALAAASEPARRLMQVEAIGPQTATALVASMGDPHVFNSGRSYAASIGITRRPARINTTYPRLNRHALKSAGASA